jgi:hypothetical protein
VKLKQEERRKTYTGKEELETEQGTKKRRKRKKTQWRTKAFLRS